MIERSQLVDLIATIVEDSVVSSRDGSNYSLDESTQLFGQGGALDSLGLVSVVLDVEQELSDEHSIFITLADDKAVSQENSPFRTVGSLTDYALRLINKKGD